MRQQRSVDGFDLAAYSGTPAARPDLIVAGYVAIQPEAAAQKHVTNLRLDYTCRREPKPSSQSPSQ